MTDSDVTEAAYHGIMPMPPGRREIIRRDVSEELRALREEPKEEQTTHHMRKDLSIPALTGKILGKQSVRRRRS